MKLQKLSWVCAVYCEAGDGFFRTYNKLHDVILYIDAAGWLFRVGPNVSFRGGVLVGYLAQAASLVHASHDIRSRNNAEKR